MGQQFSIVIILYLALSTPVLEAAPIMSSTSPSVSTTELPGVSYTFYPNGKESTTTTSKAPKQTKPTFYQFGKGGKKPAKEDGKAEHTHTPKPTMPNKYNVDMHPVPTYGATNATKTSLSQETAASLVQLAAVPTTTLDVKRRTPSSKLRPLNHTVPIGAVFVNGTGVPLNKAMTTLARLPSSTMTRVSDRS